MATVMSIDGYLTPSNGNASQRLRLSWDNGVLSGDQSIVDTIRVLAAMRSGEAPFYDLAPVQDWAGDIVCVYVLALTLFDMDRTSITSDGDIIAPCPDGAVC